MKIKSSILCGTLISAFVVSCVFTISGQSNALTAQSPTWSAQWIGIRQTASQTNLWTCLRKEFSLAEKPKNAEARIAVDSKYWLWINGKLVVREGGLKRGPNPQDTYFDEVELAPYLRKGSNTIAVLAWYWGKPGFSYNCSGKAGFVFELDASGTKIISDDTWKGIRHPAYGNTGEPHPNFRLQEENIHFDARLDLGDWTAAKFDDHAWPTALAFGSGIWVFQAR